MKNTIIYLIGFAGVGKLTTAKELLKNIPAKLVDNHIIANPIFCLRNGKMDDETGEKRIKYVTKVRNIVFEAMIDFADKEENFILTNVLYKDENDWYEPVLATALKRNAQFFPIVLSCSAEENKKRIQSAGRKENHKTTKPSVVDEAAETGIIQFEHPNKLEIDITNLNPEQTVEIILNHIKSKN